MWIKTETERFMIFTFSPLWKNFSADVNMDAADEIRANCHSCLRISFNDVRCSNRIPRNRKLLFSHHGWYKLHCCQHVFRWARCCTRILQTCTSAAFRTAADSSTSRWRLHVSSYRSCSFARFMWPFCCGWAETLLQSLLCNLIRKVWPGITRAKIPENRKSKCWVPRC